ncbi:hypothetical protein EVAR_42861_1 [Eumeta japonica]|uniref:Uncharacterized protein n=1 Tax=Eumeta variegata TaxID=151549 RepID=A0A4C1ZPC5_EUMVA|nr:hypothetical protein EVAR_42861_1 [Eumeta japonica]
MKLNSLHLPDFALHHGIPQVTGALNQQSFKERSVNAITELKSVVDGAKDAATDHWYSIRRRQMTVSAATALKHAGTGEGRLSVDRETAVRSAPERPLYVAEHRTRRFDGNGAAILERRF